MVLDWSRTLRECQPSDFTFSFFMTKKRIRTINGMRVLTPPRIARATRWNPDDENTGLSRQQVTNLCRAGGPPFDKRANPGGKQYLIYETPELRPVDQVHPGDLQTPKCQQAVATENSEGNAVNARPGEKGGRSQGAYARV
jgi:hypothetical protein